MAELLAEVRIKREVPQESEERITEARADFMTLGGGIILAVTLTVTIFFILSLVMPLVEQLQLLVIAILAVACWIYAVNRFSERFKLQDDVLEFKATLGRTQRFRLDEIAALRLTDLGWNLNGDFYVLEIDVPERRQPVQIGLGPCWRRQDLGAFVRTVGQSLERTEEEERSIEPDTELN